MIQSTEIRPAGAVAVRDRLWTPAFLTVALASLAYFAADGMLLPALPRFVEGPLRGGDIGVGLVVGAFSVSAFFLRPVAGRIGDRRGRRLLMVAGAGVFTASVLGYPLAGSVASLIALRLLTGVGEALFFVGATSAEVDLAPPDRRGEAISYFSLSLYVGIGVGPFVSEAVINRFGFTAAWVVAAATALVALGLSLRVPETRPKAPAAPATPARHRLVHPAGVLPGLVLLASMWGMGGFLAFVPLHALDLGMQGAGLALGLFAGVVVAIRSIGARIPDRLGAGRATRLALAAAAAGLLVVALWQTPGGLVAGTLVFGTGIALFTPALFSLAIEGVAPSERGAVIGTTSAFLDVAFGLGPATLGFVAAAIGRPGTFAAGAAVALAGLVLVVVTKLGRPSPGPR